MSIYGAANDAIVASAVADADGVTGGARPPLDFVLIRLGTENPVAL